MALTMFVLTLIVFALVNQPDNLEKLAKSEANNRMTDAEVTTWLDDNGFDRPFAVRYGEWIVGTVQGDMGERRQFRKPVAEVIGERLAHTGVPIFQEQAMKIAIDAAKFSPAEANELRKAMATFRSRGAIETLQERMVGRMIARGYDGAFAQRCFDQIKGFGEYGFPESHAASFAAAADLESVADGARVSLAGIVLIRQRPGSARGVCFITLEDETGVANLVVWPKVMEANRKVVMGARLIDVGGHVQRGDGGVIHIVARRLNDRSDALERLANDPMPIPLSRADEVIRPIAHGRTRHPRDARIIPKSRDFH